MQSDAGAQVTHSGGSSGGWGWLGMAGDEAVGYPAWLWLTKSYWKWRLYMVLWENHGNIWGYPLVMTYKELLKMAMYSIYSEFSHWTWWFSSSLWDSLPEGGDQKNPYEMDMKWRYIGTVSPIFRQTHMLSIYLGYPILTYTILYPYIHRMGIGWFRMVYTLWTITYFFYIPR